MLWHVYFGHSKYVDSQHEESDFDWTFFWSYATTYDSNFGLDDDDFQSWTFFNDKGRGTQTHKRNYDVRTCWFFKSPLGRKTQRT